MGRQKNRQRDRRRVQRQAGASAPPERATSERSGSAGLGRNTVVIGGIIMVVAIAIFVVAALRPQGANSAAKGTPTPPPISTPTATTASNTTAAPAVDGVSCGVTEQLAYHIHQHIALYDHGKYMSIPALIGIPTYVSNGQLAARCFYFIHVHPGVPNIIHVESPTQKTYTLGAFLDIWAATASTTQPKGDTFVRHLRGAGPSQVTAYLNGKRWKGNYRSIPLREHGVITLEVGKPTVPPKPFNGWAALGL